MTLGALSGTTSGALSYNPRPQPQPQPPGGPLFFQNISEAPGVLISTRLRDGM